MTAFPDLAPESVDRRWRPFLRGARDAAGGYQLYEPHPFNQRVWSIDLSVLDRSEQDALLEHYDLNRAFVGWTFFDPLPRKRTNALFGTGDGATTIFYLSGKDAEGLVVRVAGVPTVAFTRTPGLGPDGEDQVTFDVAPTNGAELRFDAADFRDRVAALYEPDENAIADRRVEASIYGISGIVIAEVIA